MRMKEQQRLPSEKEQWIVNTIEVRPIKPSERAKCMRLLDEYHYLGSIQPVGEQIIYVATGPCGGIRGVLVFCAAAKHLRYRDLWIGWTEEQRRRRLSLIANNARFLILPDYHVPNLATRILRLALDRLSDDWLRHYKHPLGLVETFVNPEQFQGTVYKAGGWVELGQTSGNGRVNRDYYVKHNKPKRLFVRQLCHNARRGLQAEHLKKAWAVVEKKVGPRCTYRAKEIRNFVEHLKTVPDFRARIQSYPLWSLLAIVALAYICGAPRGQKDLAKFARQMNHGQRRALGIRRNGKRKYPVPSQPTFCRLLRAVDARQVEAAILAFQDQIRGPAPREDIVALDGKAAKRSQGEQVLTAVTVPSLYYLGSEPVPVDKTNEIPVARALIKRLDLVDRLVGLDALHTQVETACDLLQECGADYMLTVKDNQKGIRRTVTSLFSATPAVFPPWGDNRDNVVEPGAESVQTRKSANPHSVGNA